MRTNREGIEHRAVKVSLVTGLSTLLAVGLQVISVPFCLKYWGKETYGSWLALYAAFMLIRSVDAGFVSYVGNKLNYLHHQDQRLLREHLASALAGIAVTGTIQLMIGVAAILFKGTVLFEGAILAHAANYRSALALFILISTWVLSGSYLGIVHRLLVPTGLMYQAAWWAMAFQVGQFAAIMSAALLHFDMLQTSLLFAFVQSLLYFVSADYIRRKLPEYYPWWGAYRRRIGLADLVQSMLLTAGNIIQQGAANGIVLVVSALTGPASVPTFSTVRTLSNLWSNVTNVLTTPLLPDVVRYHATGEAKKLVISCETYWVLVGSAVNFGVLITYPLINPIYGIWTTHVVPLNKPLLCQLLGSVVLSNVGGLITLYLNGINSISVLLRASVLRGFLSVALGGLLCLHFGLAGLGTGILAGEMGVLLLQGHFFFRREISRSGEVLPLKSIVRTAASATFVLVFLAVEGLGLSFSEYIHVVALVGVVVAAHRGWVGLEASTKARLVRLVAKNMFRSSRYLP